MVYMGWRDNIESSVNCMEDTESFVIAILLYHATHINQRFID